MSTTSGRRPVLATLTAAQVPALGPISPVRGLAAGVKSALWLVDHVSPADHAAFAAAVRNVRSNDLFDFDFSREFAAGYALIAAELQRIGGLL